MMTWRCATAWVLFWMGDVAAGVAINWPFWVLRLLAPTYRRLMSWSITVQGRGPGPWIEDEYSDF